MTAVEWLIKEHFGGIENCTPDFKYHIEQAKAMEKEQIHASINEQVDILRDTLDEMMAGFESEEDRMNFILDICNGYKNRIKSK